MANTKVTYQSAAKDGLFAFHKADGSLVRIDHSGYTTEDAGEIAYLDTVSFVKRAGKSGGKEE